MMYLHESTIDRMISWHGEEFTFCREEENEYGGATGALVPVKTLKGIYHESEYNFGFIDDRKSDATDTRIFGNTAIMCKYSDTVDLQREDLVRVNRKLFRITGFTNPKQLDIVAEISLEEVVIDGK